MGRGALLGFAVALALALVIVLFVAMITVLQLWTFPFLIVVGFVVMGAMVGRWANMDCVCGHSKLMHNPWDGYQEHCRTCGPKFQFGMRKPEGCARFRLPRSGPA